MFVSIKKSIVLLIITFGVTGCMSVRELYRPLPKGSRIAVVSNFRNQALFQRVGTSVLDNVSFYRRIPGLRINPFLTTIIANDLYKSKRFRVIPIYHHPENDLLDVDVMKLPKVTPQFKSYLSRIIAGKQIDTIVLVVPDFFDFGKGQYSDNIWHAVGYGLFNRAFMFIQTDRVFSAYKTYLIDARTYRVLASARGSFEKRVHGTNVAWGKGYKGVSPGALVVINKTLRQEIPGRLTALIHEMGLP